MKTAYFLLLAVSLFLTGWVSAQETAPAVPAPVAPLPAANDVIAPAPAASDAPVAAPAPVVPTPAPEAEEPVAKATAVALPKSKFTLPSHDSANPELDYIGHRFNEPNDSGGWGWVKFPKDNWKTARWVALLETPGIAPAPWRALGAARDADQNYEYRMHGFFAPFQVYDPHTNEMIDVFVLESFETIGPAQPLSIASGPKDRHAAHMRSTFSSRGSHEDEY